MKPLKYYFVSEIGSIGCYIIWYCNGSMWDCLSLSAVVGTLRLYRNVFVVGKECFFSSGQSASMS